jgi:hypothetical protein
MRSTFATQPSPRISCRHLLTPRRRPCFVIDHVQPCRASAAGAGDDPYAVRHGLRVLLLCEQLREYIFILQSNVSLLTPAHSGTLKLSLQVLGIPPGSDTKKIESAYRKLKSQAEKDKDDVAVKRIEQAHNSLFMASLNMRLSVRPLVQPWKLALRFQPYSIRSPSTTAWCLLICGPVNKFNCRVKALWRRRLRTQIRQT